MSGFIRKFLLIGWPRFIQLNPNTTALLLFEYLGLRSLLSDRPIKFEKYENINELYSWINQ